MKKNGFTLIELLATLVILSVVMTVVVVGFSSYINKSNRTYYKDLENTARQATMDFFSDHRNYFPKETGKTREINLQDLINQHYLEQIVDANKQSCTGTAKVTRRGSNQYDYKVCIKCPSRNDSIGDGC